jgi:hypothetical protein
MLSKQSARVIWSAETEGIFQFMPDTWEYQLHQNPADILSFRAQANAVGIYMQKTYHEMMTHDGHLLNEIRRDYFNDDEVAFLRFFMAPVLINSYNAGTGRLRGIIKWFEERPRSEKENLTDSYPRGFGNDLFYKMAEATRGHHENPALKRYGQDAREYTPRVYALAHLLQG